MQKRIYRNIIEEVVIIMVPTQDKRLHRESKSFLATELVLNVVQESLVLPTVTKFFPKHNSIIRHTSRDMSISVSRLSGSCKCYRPFSIE